MTKIFEQWLETKGYTIEQFEALDRETSNELGQQFKKDKQLIELAKDEIKNITGANQQDTVEFDESFKTKRLAYSKLGVKNYNLPTGRVYKNKYGKVVEEKPLPTITMTRQ